MIKHANAWKIMCIDIREDTIRAIQKLITKNNKENFELYYIGLATYEVGWCIIKV